MEYNKMRELNSNEIKEVNGGGISWSEGKNAILGLGLAGLTIGTGGAGIFGLAIYAALAYVDEP